MTWDDAVELLATVFETKAVDVANGAYGPLITLRVTPSLKLSMSEVEGGLVVVNPGKPGGSLFFSNEFTSKLPAVRKWLAQYLQWQEGERFAEFGEGLVGAPPRVKAPAPLDLRGTVMTVDEAFLGFMIETDDTIAILEEPFYSTGTALQPTTEWWTLLVGVIDAAA